MNKTPAFRDNISAILLLAVYVILLMFQINQFPLERYSGWDQFWVDVRSAGVLLSLKHALSHLELPVLSPYTSFGWNLAGDHHSFWAFPNILITFLPPSAVLIICQLLALLAGAIGAFFYLRFLTKKSNLAILGGIMYVSIPFTISLFYFNSSGWGFYLIPTFLLLIHRILENPARKYLFLFVLFSALSIGFCDIYFLIVVTTVVFTYAMLTGFGYYRFPLYISFKKSALLAVLCLLAGSYYIVPLFHNLREIGTAVQSFKLAGIIPLSDIGLELDFIETFKKLQGVESLYLPVEGSALSLYLPGFFYIIILFAIIFGDVIFRRNPRQLVLVAALMLVGFLMFLESVAFYSSLTAKILPGLRESAKGALRYHLNLLPFVSLLASFICIFAINSLTNNKLKIGIYVAVLSSSLLLDERLFNILPIHLERPFGSSNLFLVPIGNPLHLLPFLNLMLILLLFSENLLSILKKPFFRYSFLLSYTFLLTLTPLLAISGYNEWFANGQEGRQPPLTRNPYRWESYLERKKCIDSIIFRYDPNYRTLYTGKGNVVPYDGQDRKLIAETEVHVAAKEKVLFSYKEFEHPFTGLLRGTFRISGSGFYPSNIMPPLSREVVANINAIKLMGVKWIISADEEINDERLLYHGQCNSPEGPAGRLGLYREGGNLFIYELINPTGVAFWSDGYLKVNQQNALRSIFEKKDAPWINGTVYLEEDPSEENAPPRVDIGKEDTGREEILTISRETFNLVELQTNASKQKFLVLSYYFRPGWKAFVDSEPAKIYRAYGGFMCVMVPSGRHTVKFYYHHLDIYFSFALTIIAFLFPFGIIKRSDH